MRLQDQWSSGYEDLTKLSFNNHQISSNRHPISSSVTNQLTVVTTIAPKHNNLSHFKTGNTDAEIDGTETACIRPQLFYKPNVHPDSSAYKMVISCPADFPDALKTKKCKAGQNNTNISDAIPITSKLTGLTYVNKHCLFCNEPQVSTASCDEWQIQLDDRYTNYRHRIILYPQSLMYWASNYFFNVHFVPKTQSSVKNCITYDVSSCNQTGLWDNYNKSIESVCRHGDDLPITHSVNGNILLFKNIACVHCNAPPDFSDSRLFCAYMSSYTGYPDFQRPRQTLTLYFNGLAALPKPDIEEIPVSYIETSVLDNIPAVSCGQGLLAILVR